MTAPDDMSLQGGRLSGAQTRLGRAVPGGKSFQTVSFLEDQSLCSVKVTKDLHVFWSVMLLLSDRGPFRVCYLTCAAPKVNSPPPDFLDNTETMADVDTKLRVPHPELN